MKKARIAIASLALLFGVAGAFATQASNNNLLPNYYPASAGGCVGTPQATPPVDPNLCEIRADQPICYYKSNTGSDCVTYRFIPN